jgi:hypothetical protein
MDDISHHQRKRDDPTECSLHAILLNLHAEYADYTVIFSAHIAVFRYVSNHNAIDLIKEEVFYDEHLKQHPAERLQLLGTRIGIDFSYSGILLLHTIGMAFVVGVNACIDLRVLGFAPAVRLGLEKFFPMLWFGFWLNAIIGTILLAIDIVNKTRERGFLREDGFHRTGRSTSGCCERMCFAIRRSTKYSFEQGENPGSYFIDLWLGAITSGRLLAYVGPGIGSK